MACKTCKNVKVVEPGISSAPVPPASRPVAIHVTGPQPIAPPNRPAPIYAQPQPSFTHPIPAANPKHFEAPAPVVQVNPSHAKPPAPEMVFKDASSDSVRIVEADERNAQRKTIVIDSKEAPRSYAEIQIPPSEAPDVQTLRSQDFRFSLVEIGAAAVINGFCAPVNEEPEKPCPDCSPEIPQPVCLNPCAEKVCESQGHELAHCWTDAKPVREMLPLGRVGRCLARLVGEGVLWLGCDGMVRAIRDVPLRVSHLWHQWFKPTASSAPIIGQPMPFPYQVITDIDGNPYVIQGLSGEDSITVWDHEEKQFFQKPVTDFPICTRDKVAPAPAIELVGFEPLGQFDNPSDLRCLKRLEGEGIIHFRQVPTAPTPVCECGTCDPNGQVQDFTTIAEFLPNPQVDCSGADCPSILAFIDGAPRWVNASQLECLRGPAGQDGKDGANGADGEPVTVATYNACTNCAPTP